MTDKQLTELAKEANRIREAAMHSAQSQFEQAKIWGRVHLWLGVPAVTFAAIAGVGGISKWFGVVPAGIITLIAASLMALQTFLDLNKKTESAKSAGNAYLSIQQDARILEKVDLQNMPYEDARKALAKLVTRQQETNGIAPLPSPKARTNAKKNIDEGGQDYKVDTQ